MGGTDPHPWRHARAPWPRPRPWPMPRPWPAPCAHDALGRGRAAPAPATMHCSAKSTTPAAAPLHRACPAGDLAYRWWHEVLDGSHVFDRPQVGAGSRASSAVCVCRQHLRAHASVCRCVSVCAGGWVGGWVMGALAHTGPAAMPFRRAEATCTCTCCCWAAPWCAGDRGHCGGREHPPGMLTRKSQLTWPPLHVGTTHTTNRTRPAPAAACGAGRGGRAACHHARAAAGLCGAGAGPPPLPQAGAAGAVAWGGVRMG